MLKISTLKITILLAVILALGLLLPERGVIPVYHATPNDWNSKSFWYAPWGKSGVHKGVDIFAKQGTPVLSSVDGIVIFTGNIDMGGNVIAVLGSKWRIHYYAHLATIDTNPLRWVSHGKVIATVGSSGNAVGKPPHLHYSVLSLIPYPWLFSTKVQGWKRMFYMNPVEGINL